MTDDNIKEVINRTSIVEIINSSVPLKKKGSNYFGLSPFKKEKTPSFSVNEEKKIFHCFSTGEHGNVIDFLIKVKGYSFKEISANIYKFFLINFFFLSSFSPFFSLSDVCWVLGRCLSSDPKPIYRTIYF